MPLKEISLSEPSEFSGFRRGTPCENGEAACSISAAEAPLGAQEGVDAPDHPLQCAAGQQMALAAQQLGLDRGGEELPRPAEHRRTGKERIAFGGDDQRRSSEGPLAFWIMMLRANQGLLRALGQAREGHALDAIHYPHPISGPLDMRQRLEFLRFHLDRHRKQIEAIRFHPGFPASS
jgi:hypothetical protein